MEGPKGDDGMQGPPGMTGQQGPPADSAVIAALQARVEALEKQLTDPECPPGYERDGLGNPMNPDSVACYLGTKEMQLDRVVRVGHGRAAFWIDAYEATLWNGPGATAQPVTSGRADGLQVTWNDITQQYIVSPIYAWSRFDVIPSSGVTWFLANTACAQSGKRLPTTREWLLAAVGTLDPPDPNLVPGCLTSGGVGPRSTSKGQNCRSYWGAEDMVGNLLEWTNEWYAAAASSQGFASPWPSSFAGGGDQTNGVGSEVIVTVGMPAQHAPAAGTHGGNYTGYINGGLFSLDLAVAPSYADQTIGFRCVIPR